MLLTRNGIIIIVDRIYRIQGSQQHQQHHHDRYQYRRKTHNLIGFDFHFFHFRIDYQMYPQRFGQHHW